MPSCASKRGRAGEKRAGQLPCRKRQTPRPRRHARPVSKVNDVKERGDQLSRNDGTRRHGLSQFEKGTIVHLKFPETGRALPWH